MSGFEEILHDIDVVLELWVHFGYFPHIVQLLKTLWFVHRKIELKPSVTLLKLDNGDFATANVVQIGIGVRAHFQLFIDQLVGMRSLVTIISQNYQIHIPIRKVQPRAERPEHLHRNPL